LKDEFIRQRGYWRPWTEGLLRLNPDFLSAYARYAGYPAATGPLSRKMCELIYVALDGSATHLFRSGLALHMGLRSKVAHRRRRSSRSCSSRPPRVWTGCNLGVEILVEELAIAGRDAVLPRDELSAEQRELRDDYQARFGDWPDFCDHLLRLDPGYFAVMLELLAVAPPSNGLDVKSRGLISLALSACFTSLNPHGLRLQIRRALRLGTDHREILQVLQMTAHLGVSRLHRRRAASARSGRRKRPMGEIAKRHEERHVTPDHPRPARLRVRRLLPDRLPCFGGFLVFPTTPPPFWGRFVAACLFLHSRQWRRVMRRAPRREWDRAIFRAC
jgi:alkylhydroperoxidase/carboxymuconolactone decarboxylase family protein YurZ